MVPLALIRATLGCAVSVLLELRPETAFPPTTILPSDPSTIVVKAAPLVNGVAKLASTVPSALSRRGTPPYWTLGVKVSVR